MSRRKKMCTKKELLEKIERLEKKVEELQREPTYIPQPYPAYPQQPIMPTWPRTYPGLWCYDGTDNVWPPFSARVGTDTIGD
jgi:hypothetical protein